MRRGAPAPLRPEVLAVHPDRHRRQPLRDPARPDGHRPAPDRRPRLLLSRLGRRDDRHPGPGRPGRRARGQHGPAGRPGGHDPGRALQRSRGARSGPQPARCGRPPDRAGPDQHRDRPARAGLSRGRPRADPALRHAPDHRRDSHDLRWAGWLHQGVRPRSRHPGHRQDDRRGHSRGHLRLQRGAGRPDRRLPRDGQLGCGWCWRDPGWLRPVPGRGPGHARRGPHRGCLRADDPAGRALGRRRRRGDPRIGPCPGT